LTMSSGSVFHRRAPATENARSPTVFRRVDGTSSRPEAADVNRRRVGMSAMRRNSDDRQTGAKPWSARNVNSANLNCANLNNYAVDDDSKFIGCLSRNFLQVQLYWKDIFSRTVHLNVFVNQRFLI
jgi:hypothetical protein